MAVKQVRPVSASEHDSGNPFPQQAEGVTSLSWSPTGAALAAGSREGTVRLWR